MALAFDGDRGLGRGGGITRGLRELMPVGAKDRAAPSRRQPQVAK